MELSYTEADLQQFLKNPAVRIAGNSITKNFDSVTRKIGATDHIADAGKMVDIPRRGKPNKTEAEYGRILGMEFPGCPVRFEAVTLRLKNGLAYTPDFLVIHTEWALFVEVKNAGYKHASYGRSKMAYLQARLDFPMFQYRWAVKDKSLWSVVEY